MFAFAGDWDACVPYTDNEAWTEGMGYPVQVPWKPWAYTESDNTTQVGGYVVKYEVEGGQFEYRTVRSAGHMVGAGCCMYVCMFICCRISRWVGSP